MLTQTRYEHIAIADAVPRIKETTMKAIKLVFEHNLMVGAPKISIPASLLRLGRFILH